MHLQEFQILWKVIPHVGKVGGRGEKRVTIFIFAETHPPLSGPASGGTSGAGAAAVVAQG